MRHNDFDAMLERVRAEGRRAWLDGVSREDCPYVDDPEPHVPAAWRGGWAEAALGLPDVRPEPCEVAWPAMDRLSAPRADSSDSGAPERERIAEGTEEASGMGPRL